MLRYLILRLVIALVSQQESKCANQLSLLNAVSISKLPAEIKQNLTVESEQDLRYHLRESKMTCKTAAR